MRTILNFIPLIIILGCSSPEGDLSILIEKRNQHPFLIDHDRVLVAMAENQRIDEISIYPDGGAGCSLYYFELKNEIIAIDCNGMWYLITKKRIKKIGWKWDEPLPKARGQRIVRNEQNKYVTEQIDNISFSEVYRFKDPGES